MKIICDQCGSKYSVDDSKVQNKSFKITCKKCGNKIIVDNTKKAETGTDSSIPFVSQTNWDDDIATGMGADMEFDDQATKIISYQDAMNMNTSSPNKSNGREMTFDDEKTTIMYASQANTLSAATKNDIQEEWYVHINGQQVGPLNLTELQNKIKNEKLPETTNVWKTGMSDWGMIKDIPELSSYIVKSSVDPFGSMDSNTAAFGNDSLLDDSDAESLFNDKQQSSSASSFSANQMPDPFANSGGFDSGLDLKSLIDQDSIEEEDEDDSSSKSKVIDFRDIQGAGNKKIVVQHASFNASTASSGGSSNKMLIIALVAILLLAVGGAGLYFGVIKKGSQEETQKLTKVFLTSVPTDAIIKFNGKLMGKTGGELFSVKPGSYQVKIIKDGYEEINDVIIVKKDDFIKKYTLIAKPKQITIKTGIIGADVTVGDQKAKTNPNGEAVITIKPASSIAVKVEKDGVTKIATTINVTVEGDSAFNLAALAVDTPSNTENTTNKGNTEAKQVATAKTPTHRKSTRRTRSIRRATKSVKKAPPKDDLDDLFNDTPKTKKKAPSNLPKTLTQAQVLRVIKGVYPKVKTCGKNAGITGKVKVKFKINGTGSVSAIQVAPNGGAAKNCIYSKVRSMRFPKFSGAPIPVTFPFKM